LIVGDLAATVRFIDLVQARLKLPDERIAFPFEQVVGILYLREHDLDNEFRLDHVHFFQLARTIERIRHVAGQFFGGDFLLGGEIFQVLCGDRKAQERENSETRQNKSRHVHRLLSHRKETIFPNGFIVSFDSG
jgi:hypothetical protein